MSFLFLGHTVVEVISMSTISPSIRPKFDSMPPALQQAVLDLNVPIETLGDLMSCLERIIAQGEAS